MPTPDRPAGRGDKRPPRSAGPAARPSSRDSSARPSSRDNRTRTGDGAEREWVYDPRREARRQLARVPLPEDVDARELDHDVRKELRPLAKDTAELVAKHLVMAGRLIDDEPQQALAHARAARALAGRVAPAREANGLVAYAAGQWAEALSELRTARRLTGSPEHLAVMADCERALGRPDRALVMTNDPQAASLTAAAKVELLIVASGARRDLGQPEAAVVALQVGALVGPVKPWTVRLRYAYADALLEAGREQEARRWFALALEADTDGQTDAEERLLELDGMVFTDLQEGDDQDEDAEHEAPTAP
jgi:tetratricopeptide (TPR) repeat protein